MKCPTPFGTPPNKLNNNLVPIVRLTNIAVGSPLRRSLLKKPITPQPVIDQDDESERSRRRNEADVERRISKIVLPDLTPRIEQEMQQHFQLCLKLFVENKINVKNVWDLKIIDYMPVVLESKKQIRDYLQVGTTSLDASAKIYGMRVDDIYGNTLKLAHNMTRVDNKKEGDEENQNENEDSLDADNKENCTSKKKKTRTLSLKNKNTVLKNIKSITGQIPVLVNNCFQTRSGVDFNSITDLRTFSMPMHPYCHHFMILKNDPAWMTYAMVDKNFEKESKITRPWPLTANKNNIKICSPFAGFEIDNWDPAQDVHLKDSSNSSYNDVVVYDENGLPIPELDGSIHNFTILGGNEGGVEGSSEDERVEAHSAIHVEPEFITDFRPEERNTISGEYSYSIPNSADDQFQMQLLAGPSHWKFKHIRPAARKFSGVVQQHQQKPKRQKKNKKEDHGLLDVLNCSLFDEDFKYKPRKNPIRYDPARIMKQQILFEQKFLNMNIPLLSKSQFIITNYVDPPKDGVEDEVLPYNYQNPQDSEYCSQPNLQDFDDDGVCNNDDSPLEEEFDLVTEKCANAEPEMLADVGQFLGDNLVEAPQLVQKNFISYALQPKKLNIKKLKNAVHRCLVTDKDTPKIKKLSDEQLRAYPILPTRFQNIYKRLPELMSTSEKKELSCATVFVALLHLINEHQLEIVKDRNNMADFEIKK